MITRRQSMLSAGAALTSFAAETNSNSSERVRLTRIPRGGLQPQVAVDQQGNLHLVYYGGDPSHGDLFYVRSKDAGKTFSSPIQVNSQSGSAIAVGTIRGGQLALGTNGRVHVAWNGSMQADPKGPVNPESMQTGMPMLYARLDDTGNAFEAQRILMLHSFGLDGGGSIAADSSGNVYVAWHGIGSSEVSGNGLKGEARRRVWITRSSDDGRTFATEKSAWSEQTGACGCCGMKLYSDKRGNLSALYRSATNSIHRDIYLLSSKDKGASFNGRLLQKWEINACPMSSMDFSENGKEVVAAWETGGQVYWSRISGGSASEPISAPGEGKGRKHPRIAVNQEGEVLFTWTEGTGWQKGGTLSWQLFDPKGRASSEGKQIAAIPAWSFAGVVATAGNAFTIIC